MLTYDLFTDPGGRSVNEDSVRAVEKDGNYCFVVCDGLGGHGKGDEASSVVADKMTECFLDFGTDADYIQKAIEISHDLLLQEQKNRNAIMQMKTTIVVMTVVDNVARWGFIGDSRLYHFEKSKLIERTVDHSVPQMLALIKEIKEKDIRFHPDRNRLLSVMGTKWDSAPYEISEPHKLKKNDIFILCSDGFWEFIDEKNMKKIIKHNSEPEILLSKMIEEIRKNGQNAEMDNFSAVLIKV